MVHDTNDGNPSVILKIYSVPSDHEFLRKEKAMGLFYPYADGDRVCEIYVAQDDDNSVFDDTLHHEIVHFLMHISDRNVYSHGKRFKKILKLLNEEL